MTASHREEKNKSRRRNIRAQGDFSPLKFTVRLYSPQEIEEESYGEIRTAETTHYRTGEYIIGGLHCPVIFGPKEDYKCNCGLYKNGRKGTVCEKCGVEIIQSYARRVRMAHITLMDNVVNPIYLPHIGPMLDLPTKIIERIAFFSLYIITDPGSTPLKYKQVFEGKEIENLHKEYGMSSFTAETGSRALRTLLSQISLEDEIRNLREDLEKNLPDIKKNRKQKTYLIFSKMLEEKINPADTILTVLPVLPADLRPIVAMDDNIYAEDTNDLYRTIIFRNTRLAILTLKLASVIPDEITKNESRMLLDAVIALLVGNKVSVQKPISSQLGGKMGIPRAKLEGKRTDFSARAVIVPMESLNLDQCGVPKSILVEMFRLHLYEKLQTINRENFISAKDAIDNNDPMVYHALNEVIKNRFVLLNRAPTLYKLGIQAFKIVIVEGDAIGLHPLVCTAYNADFDGDCVHLHLPLTIKANLEARELMLSSKNILSPVSGKVIISPTKDMALGFYQLTMEGSSENVSKSNFSSLNEIQAAMLNKEIDLHTKILTLYDCVDEKGNIIHKTIYTTPGRMLVWNIMPRHPKISFDLINKPISSKQIQVLMDHIFYICGREEVVKFADAVKELSFLHAYKSGVSFCVSALKEPQSRKKIISKSIEDHNRYEDMYHKGLMTLKERENKLLSVWQTAVKDLCDNIQEMLENNRDSHLSKIYLSGARGSIDQIRQLIGIKGLPLKDSTSVYMIPIISNMTRGINSLLYFYLTKGGRDGAKDKALNTATSGYLARRMADASQDCIVKRHDCGTYNGIIARNMTHGSSILMNVSEVIHGRVNVEDIYSPKNNSMLISRNTLINSEHEKLLNDHDITSLLIRSPVTCELLNGICALCYGVDISTGALVDVGEAVGIVAAQAAAEPSTQMTMKTFQSGGTAQGYGGDSNILSPYAGRLNISGRFIENEFGEMISANNNCTVEILNESNYAIVEYNIPYASTICIPTGSMVEKGQEIVTWDDRHSVTIAEETGEVIYQDLILNITYNEIVDPLIKKKKTYTIERKSMDLSPALIIKTSNNEEILYPLSAETEILVPNGKIIQKGTILTKKQNKSVLKGDIVDGLTKIIEILEIRASSRPALLASVPGKVKIEKDNRGRKKISIICGVEEIIQGYVSPEEEQFILVRNNEEIKIGNILVNGELVLKDVLRTGGVRGLVDVFLRDLQSIFKSQGITTSNKHLEIILRQMLKLVEVTHNPHSKLPYIPGQLINKTEIIMVNRELEKTGDELIRYEQHIQGITAAAASSFLLLSLSFQDFLKRLSFSSLVAETDDLCDAKSNILMGVRAPVGTGHSWRGAVYSGRKNNSAELEMEKNFNDLDNLNYINDFNDEYASGMELDSTRASINEADI